ncbi:M28 family metallopeptidase [Marinicauda sp. Alg238-R41]|uniref:M28 family metallopeptidase n=1 Tax=Marinicauda sp. Alg238-R41 TaxID=2993447 RepID=UPI0022E33102|nr:M28 family metallopeptidase [Marinicauda sp. Alg238-R41]
MQRLLYLTGTALAGLALTACGEPVPDETDTGTTDAATGESQTATGAMANGSDAGEWPVHEETAPAITEADFAYRISTLADDRFGGRGPGSERGEPAADWIAEEMDMMGLEPAGEDGTWFQDVPLLQITLDEEASSFDVSVGGEPMGLELGADAVYWSQNPEETVSLTESDVVFVGYGIVAPEYDWNDYEGVDVEGKTVVILVNDPGFADPDSGLFNGESMTYYGRWTYKYEEAARQGAEGAIIVHQTEPASYPWEVVFSSWTGAQSGLVPPEDYDFVDVQGWVQLDVAERLFESAGLNFNELYEAAANADFEAVPLENTTLSAELHQTFEETVSRNVAGRLPGTERPEEHVLFMAHWDHIGERLNFSGEDQIYNGAVDNASGTSAMLEIAQRYATAEEQPDRSVIFVAVTAEEQGLLGSAYYADNPLVPLDQTVGGFNFDGMLPVGPTEDVVVIGYGASELEDILEQEASADGRYLSPDPNPEAGYFYRSDHVSLARKGVPMLYADGGSVSAEHGADHVAQIEAAYRADAYHKPADEYDESWDLSGFVEDATLMYRVSRELADSDRWPNWYEGNEFRSLRDEMMAESEG